MKKYYISFIPLLFLLGGCNQKENQIIECDPDVYIPCEPNLEFTSIVDTCFELLPEPNVGWNYLGDNVFFKHAQYNAANPNEFLFLRTQREPFEKSFHKVNICTGVQSKITDSFGYRNVRWGSKDWILYVQSDNSIGIIKSNGDSMTQITNENQYFTPSWMEDGDRIFSGVYLDNGERKSVILNKEGIIIDSFNIVVHLPDHLGNKIAGFNSISVSTSGFIGYLNLDTKEFINLFETASPAFLHKPLALEWLDEENIIWSDIYGLYQININSTVPDTLIQNCDNRRFHDVTASPSMDGKVLLTFIESENPDSSSIYSQNNILIYDTNTGEKNIISLN